MKNQSLLMLFKACIIAIVACMINSCVTIKKMYSGDDLPEQQVAIIENPKKLATSYIDGEEIFMVPDEIHFLPGNHVMKIYSYGPPIPSTLSYQDDAYHRHVTKYEYEFRFHVTAGHRYRLYGGVDQRYNK